jgi:hypothetical protein
MAVYLASGDRVRTTNELIDWWVEQASTPRKPGERAEHEEKSSIIARGDSLYHYGHHFELARIVRTKGGRPKLFVLNGDSVNLGGRYGPSTGERQRQVESLVRQTDVPFITIPFSALGAAGVDISTVTPLEVRPDRTEYIQRESRERPGPFLKMDDPNGATYEHSEQRYGWVHKETGEVFDGTPPFDERYGETAVYSHGPYAHKSQRVVQVDNPNEATVTSYPQHSYPSGHAKLGDDGIWRWKLYRHWLGDSLFKARVTEHRVRNANETERQIFLAYEEWSTEHRYLRQRERDHRTRVSDMVFVESLYAANDDRLKHITAPRPDADELAAAREDVVAAERRIAEHEEKAPPHNEVERVGDKLIVRHTVRRWAKFLSSFDYNEPHRPYFMCELRYGCPANTVDEAIEDLKPPVIRDALAVGLNVLRHGDVFLIPTSLTTDELKSRAVTFRATRTVKAERWWMGEYTPAVTEEYDEPIRKLRGQGDATVLGTNHSGTWTIVTNDGDYYVRGRMYHTPGGWRDPDHRVLKLGDGQTWYRCVKNTVPLDKSTGSSRGSSNVGGRLLNQSGRSRAWMLGGAVD